VLNDELNTRKISFSKKKVCEFTHNQMKWVVVLEAMFGIEYLVEYLMSKEENILYTNKIYNFYLPG
jgi:hypothetical protein